MNKFPEYFEFLQESEKCDRIDKQILEKLGAESKHRVEGRFSYIPFQEERTLYDMFQEIRKRLDYNFYTRDYPTKFLDVGAGTGRIVRLAKFCGIDAVGVEFYQPYVEEGRKMMELGQDSLICRDAFTLDAEFLREFLVIYTYMPISRPPDMSRLHIHLFCNIQRPTVMVEMYPYYYPMNVVHRSQSLNNSWLSDKVKAVVEASPHFSY